MEKQLKDYTDDEVVAQLLAAGSKSYTSGPSDQPYKGTPLNQFLRALASDIEPWCCKQIKLMKNSVVTFSDGTILRVHFCPRCGKEL